MKVDCEIELVEEKIKSSNQVLHNGPHRSRD